MFKLGKALVLVAALAVAPAAIAAADPVAGTWQTLPSAPAAVFPPASAWTGKQLIVVGRRPFESAAIAESYDPATKVWKRLAQPPKLGSDPGCCKVAWARGLVLVWGAFSGAAFDPATDTWRTLPQSVLGGIVVWTGREAIGWGGGCCGDARANGEAYNPSTDAFRKLPRSPLAPSQSPVGAWTGRELLVFVSGLTPDGKPYPASLARAAAYNPTKNTWRRLAAMPKRGGTAVWNGRELLLVGTGTHARSTLAFDPGKNRWRALASLPFAARAATVVWTGKRVYVWSSSRGLSYDPATNRWSVVPNWPLRARGGASVTWTGRSLIVWGGEIGTPPGTNIPPKFPLDGAAFTPNAR